MNEKEKILDNLMKSLVIADTKTLADVSGMNYALAYKYLNNLADIQKIEKCNGFWRLYGCQSDWKEHSQLLTKSLAQIIKKYQAVIYREKTIPEIGLRPDALILLIKENKGRCLILEVMNNETESYFLQKKNTWLNWEGATKYLSGLFQYVVPHFEILTSDELIPYLEEEL